MSYKTLPYKSNMTLFTDLYQLTMGQVYWSEGTVERESVFHHFFRSNPFGGGFAVACGLELIVDYLQNLKFSDDDTDFLATICGNDGKPLFRREYLEYLKKLEFSCDVDAAPEGSIVFAHEPLVRVKGALIQSQFIETALLTLGNYATAIATEAARITIAAGDVPVHDFSARRAPGMDGSITASRSAYIGGFAGTSNVWAARHFGIPAKGTMAHSLVMSFDTELEAFMAYARTMPNNCLFLVDTYGTIEGVRHAIETGKFLRANGFEMIGVRLDSGDLANLSKRARKMLDEAGFPNAAIMATNDLNEFLMQSLRAQRAAISIYGVGTKLMTASLSGVYKLAAIRDSNSKEWMPKIKLSDQPVKTSIPGVLQVRRFRGENGNVADCIFDETRGVAGDGVMIDLLDKTKQWRLPQKCQTEDLLKPVFRGGKLVGELPNLEEIRQFCRAELLKVPEGTKRFENPDQYRVGLEKALYELREKLIFEHRQASDLESEPN